MLFLNILVYFMNQLSEPDLINESRILISKMLFDLLCYYYITQIYYLFCIVHFFSLRLYIYIGK